MATRMAETTGTAAWALQYASAYRWRVFPVVPGKKQPKYKGWQRDATTDPEQIDRYWRGDPAPNIGIVCGEQFDAFDIEAEYVDALVQYLNSNGLAVPETPVATTGRGGIHILTTPTGVGAGRDLYLAGTHIGELKSTGGLIVACPSVTSGRYEWLYTPDRMELGDPSAWMLGLLERPRRSSRRFKTRVHSSAEGMQQLERLHQAVVRAGIHRRNNFLYWAVRRALEEGIPERYTVLSLKRAALAAGLEEDEIEKTIESACEAATRELGS